MKNKIVIGMGFGDEGKGRVVDYLCQTTRPKAVVRFSGGHQAAHTVWLNEKKYHVFSNFGSGTLRNINTYISKFCTVDPVGILNEYYCLNNDVNPFIFIDRKCPVVTPYDKLHNKKSDKYNKNGTCGVGFGTTLQRESDFYSLLFEDLYNPTILKIKLDMISNYYENQYNIDIDLFIDECENLINRMGVLRSNITNTIKYDDGFIFEGSQGLLLDQDIGFFPHVTRGNVCLKNLNKMGVSKDSYLYLVTRAFQTRHGNGPITNLHHDFDIKNNPYEINGYNENQGHFRRSMLDLDLLKYSVGKNADIKAHPNKVLVVTCLDLLNEYKLTENGNVISFIDESQFCEYIRKILNIKYLYISKSSYGKIKRVK